MPQLSDLVEKRKFVKKEYRPWDLSGTGTVDGKEIPNKTVEPEATTVDPEQATVPVEKTPTKEEPSIAGILADSIELSDNKTGNISGNKQVTIKKQSDNIKATKPKQPDNIKVTIREHTDNAIDNVRDNIDGLAYLIESIKKLCGIQKSIFFYVLNVCSARGVLDTGHLLSNDLANAASCSIGSAKTSLIRLIEKTSCPQITR